MVKTISKKVEQQHGKVSGESVFNTNEDHRPENQNCTAGSGAFDRFRFSGKVKLEGSDGCNTTRIYLMLKYYILRNS